MKKLILPAVLLSLCWAAPARAETMIEALAAAYLNNPQVNSARAGVRAQDEAVPIAKSFYRPTITGTADISRTYVNPGRTDVGGNSLGHVNDAASTGVGFQQYVFRGFRTRNAVRGANADVRASRELLDNTVQNVLLDAADAYLSVIRDRAILDIRRRNVDFLQEQLRSANELFNVGENTRTDVAQSRAALASALSEIAVAEANLASSMASYVQIIGHEPTNLSATFPFSAAVPPSLPAALTVAQTQHPAIRAAIYQADSAAFGTRQIEGEMLPTVSIEGSASRDWGLNGYDTSDSTSAQIVGRVSIPFYQGGAVAARVRQAKELEGQSRIEIDLYRDQVRAAVSSSWVQIEATRSAISATGTSVEAANIALSGVQEERRVGQRTTLDVLDAQATVLTAQENLIVARYNQLIASYSLLSAVGRLLPGPLNLPVTVYRPQEHYEAVDGKWYGVRTPDGR